MNCGSRNSGAIWGADMCTFAPSVERYSAFRIAKDSGWGKATLVRQFEVRLMLDAPAKAQSENRSSVIYYKVPDLDTASSPS